MTEKTTAGPLIHLDLAEPPPEDIAYLRGALYSAGRSWDGKDLQAVIEWYWVVQLHRAWLVEVRAGRAALVVEHGQVRLAKKREERPGPATKP